EGNNWILKNFPLSSAISPFEHSSIDEPARRMGLEILGNDGYDLKRPKERKQLISVMTVNNETGALLGASKQREHATYLHSDITQAAGKIPVNLEPLDFATLSAHKLYGPKGVGAVYARGGVSLEPMIVGGGQEDGLRSGTMNVPGIVGMGAAADVALTELEEQ